MNFKMSDKELLRYLMYKNEWTQEQLAERLGFTRPQVSKVVNDKLKLRRAVRKLAERLFEEIEELEKIKEEDS